MFTQAPPKLGTGPYQKLLKGKRRESSQVQKRTPPWVSQNGVRATHTKLGSSAALFGGGRPTLALGSTVPGNPADRPQISNTSPYRHDLDHLTVTSPTSSWGFSSRSVGAKAQNAERCGRGRGGGPVPVFLVLQQHHVAPPPPRTLRKVASVGTWNTWDLPINNDNGQMVKLRRLRSVVKSETKSIHTAGMSPVSRIPSGVFAVDR